MPKKITKKQNKKNKTRSLPIQTHEPISLRDAINQMVDESFVDPHGWGGEMAEMSQTRFPKVDVSEPPKLIKIKAEIPGVKEKDIEIEVAEDHINIKGESHFEQEDKDETFYQYESRHGSFFRTIPLPAPVTDKGIKAELKDGLLIVKLLKKKVTNPKPLLSRKGGVGRGKKVSVKVKKSSSSSSVKKTKNTSKKKK